MRMSRSIACLLALTGLLAVALRAAAEEAPPQPRFDGIDYARPQAHLALSPQVGDAKQIESLAGQLKGEQRAGDPRQHLAVDEPQPPVRRARRVQVAARCRR